MSKLASIVLAAGDGKRLNSGIPKALHKVCGKPMLQHILDALREAPADFISVVVGHGMEHIQDFLGGDRSVEFVHQHERRGTGHATLMAAPLLKDWSGDVLVINGDCPLIRTESLRKLVERHRRHEAAATIMTALVDDPAGYGRVLRNDDDDVLGIREQKDCNRYESKINEINAGFYCFRADDLFPALAQLRPDNQQAELYLTDVVQILVRQGRRVEGFQVPDAAETFGVNDRVQLATAERILRRRIAEAHMRAGVTILSPETTTIDDGVHIGRDSVIHPCTILGAGTEIGDRCEIGPFAHLDGCRVESGARASHCYLVGQDVTAARPIQGGTAGSTLCAGGAATPGGPTP